ncbi:MAG: AAA family ATPase [Candidatus Geothermincolales bacterium]
MRIKSLETRGFGSVPDGKIQFGEGLTVVQGPNEAGKSFAIKAICQGLYGDAGSGSREVRELNRKWGGGGDYMVSLELEVDGRPVKIERDFAARKNRLEEGGREIKDKRTIEKRVAGMVGIPSEKAFLATACIWQEEVERLRDEAETLREILEGKIAGSGKGVKRLEEEVSKLLDGLRSKSGKKGRLVELEKEIQELEERRQEVAERLKELARNKRELAEARARIEEIGPALEDKERALEMAREYRQALEERDKRKEDYDRAVRDLNALKEAKERKEKGEQEIKKLRGELDELNDEIGGAEEFSEVQKQRSALEGEIAGLKERLEKARQLEKRAQDIEEELNKRPAIDPSLMERASSLSAEISSLRSALESLVFEVEVRAETGVPFTLTADGKAVEGSRALAHGEAEVSFPGLASVAFRNLSGGDRPLVEQLRDKEEELRGILDGYGFPDVGDMNRVFNETEKRRQELEKVRSELRGHLGDVDIQEMVAGLREKEAELDNLKNALQGLMGRSLTPEVLEEKKKRRKELEAKVRELEVQVGEDTGTIRALGEDESELEKRKWDCLRELDRAEMKVSELSAYSCSPEEYSRLEREVEDLKEELDELKKKDITLSDRIERENLGEEDLSELEEMIADKERQREALSRRYDVHRVIREGLDEAWRKTVDGFSRSIGDRMGEILSTLTGGKYSKVEVDGELGIRIFSNELGDFIDLEDKDHQRSLSTGTLDQVYFAARVAVLEVLAGDRSCPLILDDTFANFDDMGRKQSAFELLKRLAGERQVIYFTCHECPPDLDVVRIG